MTRSIAARSGMRQHLGPEELERPHGVAVQEPGPLDADDELGDAEQAQRGDLLADSLGRAEQEAAGVQVVPVAPQRVRGREYVALAPLDVGLVLARQVRPRDRERLLVRCRDARLAEHRQLRRLRAALGAEDLELPADLGDRRVW